MKLIISYLEYSPLICSDILLRNVLGSPLIKHNLPEAEYRILSSAK
jgi:hypothetical protein